MLSVILDIRAKSESVTCSYLDFCWLFD